MKLFGKWFGKGDDRKKITKEQDDLVATQDKVDEFVGKIDSSVAGGKIIIDSSEVGGDSAGTLSIGTDGGTDNGKLADGGAVDNSVKTDGSALISGGEASSSEEIICSDEMDGKAGANVKKVRFGGLRNVWEATRRLALTPVDPWFAKMAQGLSKTRQGLVGQVKKLFGSHSAINEDFWEELEEILLTADVGIGATTFIMEELRQVVQEKKLRDPSALLQALRDILGRILGAEVGACAPDSVTGSGSLPTVERSLHVQKGQLTVVLMVGVNGAGKTTTTAKLAAHYKAQGFKVLMAAADTFRAAAIDQLQVWADRIGVDLIRHQEGADPAAVVFDAVTAAKARGTELLLVDTAGRLHNKANLMEELRKIKRVAGRDLPGAPHEIILVLDATTGQNAIEQTKVFNSVTELTGLVLCKLDGTSRGGVIVAIAKEFNIPVRYIGVGEGVDDLREFDPKQFLDALFADDSQ